MQSYPRGSTLSIQSGIGRFIFNSGPLEIFQQLDDVEVGSMQLRLEYPAQGDGIVGIDGDDRISVAVIMRRVQGRQRVRENRAL